MPVTTNHIQKYCGQPAAERLRLGQQRAPAHFRSIVQVYENLYRLNEKGMDFEVSYPVDPVLPCGARLGKLTFHAIRHPTTSTSPLTMA